METIRRGNAGNFQSLETEKQQLIQQANAALVRIDKGGLAELRSVARPPPLIEQFFVAFLTYKSLSRANTDWNSAKKALADPNFLEILGEMNHDRDIPNDIKAWLYTTVIGGQLSNESLTLYTWLEKSLQYCQKVDQIREITQKLHN